jgi:hypothetical protein
MHYCASIWVVALVEFCTMADNYSLEWWAVYGCPMKEICIIVGSDACRNALCALIKVVAPADRSGTWSEACSANLAERDSMAASVSGYVASGPTQVPYRTTTLILYIFGALDPPMTCKSVACWPSGRACYT